MKKMYTLVITTIMITLFSGCGPKVISVPKEKVNIDNYSKERISNNGNVDLIIYANRAGIKPVIVKIDNQIVQQMSPYTYSYHEIEKGYHWIAANGTENDSFLCKNFTEKKHIVNVDNGMGLFDARFYLKEKDNINDIDNQTKQIIQKQKFVKSFTNNLEFEGLKIETQSKNEKMLDLITNLNNNLKEFVSKDIKENNLTIDVSLISFKDGNMFGRYFFGGLDAAKKYADSLSIKVNIIHKEKIIDTIYSSRLITGGVFGGFSSSMIKDVANEITSYIMCKFYQKQFPVETGMVN